VAFRLEGMLSLVNPHCMRAHPHNYNRIELGLRGAQTLLLKHERDRLVQLWCTKCPPCLVCLFIYLFNSVMCLMRSTMVFHWMPLEFVFFRGDLAGFLSSCGI